MWKWHSRTPHRIAQEMGMNALLITSGAESLRTGLEQAIPIGTSFQKIRKENFFLTRIMRGEAENITVLDEAGELYYSVPGDLPPDLLAVMREKCRRFRKIRPSGFITTNTISCFGLLDRLSASEPENIICSTTPALPVRSDLEKTVCAYTPKAGARCCSA